MGGDFYDVFELGENRVGVLLGDVVGKGLRAAVRVAAARYAVRSYAYLDSSPSKVMAMANEALCRESPDSDNILTVFYAVVDTVSGAMTYASAGHEPPLVCAPQDYIEELVVTGPVLGMIPEATYTECVRVLSDGEILVMFTDGITEARRDSSILFEKDGVIKHLERVCNSDPDEIARTLLEAATQHADGKLQDDAAIVVLRYRKDR